jgi:hypothetical protein
MEKHVNSIKDEVMRKPYTSPEIIQELELETRAGSPLGLPDFLDSPEN